jgi:TolB-like protein
MMQADEAGTLAALKARRADILQPLVAKHHGRVVKLMGDGVLVEFGSAVDAVVCAVELQEAMGAANAGLVDDRRILLRVGINLGEVIVEGSDLYGDGINIAARLEALANPGSVFISGKVHQEVASRLGLTFEDLGEQRLKNISAPLHVYRFDGVTSADHGTAPGKMDGSKPSIAVLPFSNMSSDSEQRYLSDGICEDIITELSRYRELVVIARNSSFRYRDKSVEMRRVGQELGAQYLVEGSLRKAGDRIRVTAQLIEAATGSHLWAERYDRELKDIFAIQDEVAQTVAGNLVGRIERSRVETARRRPTESWLAYDYVLQAVYLINHYDTDSAEALLKRSIEIDPSYARGYGILSKLYLFRYFDDLQDTTLDKALAWAEKGGVSIDEAEPDCHMRLASALTWVGRFELAETHSDQAVDLNPNNPTYIMARANLHARTGRAKEALEALQTAALREPFLPPWYWELLSVALFVEKRYEEVIKSTSRKDPKKYWDHAYLAAAYAYLGRDGDAHLEAAEVLQKRPSFSILAYAKQEPFKNPGDLQHLLDGFRKAGLPE